MAGNNLLRYAMFRGGLWGRGNGLGDVGGRGEMRVGRGGELVLW